MTRCTLAFLLCANLLSAQTWLPKPTTISPSVTFRNTISVDSDSTIWITVLQGDTATAYNYFNPEYSISTNGGTTWKTTVLPVAGQVYLSSLKAIGNKKAYLAYTDLQNGLSKVFITADFGLTWTEQNHTMNTFLNYVHGWKNTPVAVAVCDPDATGWKFFKTTNTGAMWTQVSNANLPAPVANEYFFGSTYNTVGNFMIAVTSNDRMAFTKDQGSNWSIVPAPAAGNGLLIDAFLDKDGGIYAVRGDYSTADYTHTFYYSANDGQTWTILPNDNAAPKAFEGCYTNPTSGAMMATFANGWFNPASFETRVSFNKGQTWTVVDTTARVSYIDFSGTTGYGLQAKTATDQSPYLVYKYNGSPLTGFFDQKPLDLKVEISPNPFHDKTYISLQTDVTEDILILVNSVKGTLVSSQLLSSQTGQQQIEVDLTGQPAGLYTVTFTTKSGFMSQKIVKL
jgi:photosystem II stability/assembly factor-like uncharacterized protein